MGAKKKTDTNITIAEYQQVLERMAYLDTEVKRLTWENADLKRRLWGKSSEKRALPEDPNQLNLCFESPVGVDPVSEEVEAKKVEEEQEGEYKRFRKSFKNKVKPHARKAIPKKYPRETEAAPFPDDIDLTDAIQIGEEITEQYAIKPAYVYVRRIVRSKFLLPNGKIIIAPLPVMAHPRSNASESVLAHIAVAKYADHLPLNRQIEIFERNDVHFSPSTISNWMMATAQRIEPIYNELREQVRSTEYVMADETPQPVLESAKPGSLHTGYMWAFYLPDKKAPYFEYHKGRSSEGVGVLLGGKTRIIQSDGYGVYDTFDKREGYLHLCCWAHVRRKFIEARSYDPLRADWMLDQIKELYQIEGIIKNEKLEAEVVVKLRQEKSYPIIKNIEGWCKLNYTATPDDSPIRKAIYYLYVRLEQLSGYVTRAEFKIDNNPVERCIRPLTLNRKNTLFAGSHNAAHAAAIFFSLMGTCKENKVNPYEWLNDVLIRVVQNENINDFKELLPYNWKKLD